MILLISGIEEKMVQMTYLQDRNGVTDVENKHVYMGVRGGVNREMGLTYTCYYI